MGYVSFALCTKLKRTCKKENLLAWRYVGTYHNLHKARGVPTVTFRPGLRPTFDANKCINVQSMRNTKWSRFSVAHDTHKSILAVALYSVHEHQLSQGSVRKYLVVVLYNLIFAFQDSSPFVLAQYHAIKSAGDVFLGVIRALGVFL